MTTTTASSFVGTTIGLSRFSPNHPLQAEQVYVDRISDPEQIPHPDGGFLAPRTFRIRRGRGYQFAPVLELTERQAVEMAKLILAEAGEDSYKYLHPHVSRAASRLRADAKNVARHLNDAADLLEQQ